MLGGGLGMRRSETAPAELPLQAIAAKGSAAAVHALDLGAPTRTGAGAGLGAAAECKTGLAGEHLADGNGLPWAHAVDRHGPGCAGSSTVGPPNDSRATGVGAKGRDSDGTEQGARGPGRSKALTGGEAGARLHGKAPVVAYRSGLRGEGGGTLSGPGPPGSEPVSC